MDYGITPWNIQCRLILTLFKIQGGIDPINYD